MSLVLGKSIKDLRKDRGLSQLELANLCGVTQSSISIIERGDKHPHVSTFNKICVALGVKPSIIHVMSLDRSELPENRRELFDIMYPSFLALFK